jgi:hypothetical protein
MVLHLHLRNLCGHKTANSKQITLQNDVWTIKIKKDKVLISFRIANANYKQNKYYCAVVQKFYKESGNHLRILTRCQKAGTKFRSKDPQILSATVHIFLHGYLALGICATLLWNTFKI